MERAWQTLHRAGLPLAGERTGPAPDAIEMARCVRELVGNESGTAREREALAAFVLAWADQLPRTFARVFDGDAAQLVRWAESIATDADRRIKLRRIAMESLATIL
ncbi:MAG: hypothetical protein M3Y87_17715 [Myxococcota bacterium]|nr:hypothetical protein [Myxococcota bacterium]